MMIQICIIGLILILLISAVFFVLLFNGLIQLQNNIAKAWANIDVLLKQRSNEIPNLVACVKGYMSHEKVTLEKLTKARSVLSSTDSMTRKAAVDDMVSKSLNTVFAVAESYPDLKASENFIQLQQRLSGLENELADRREFYNDTVTIYNTKIYSIPDMLIARLFGFQNKEWFKATPEDKQFVQISFPS